MPDKKRLACVVEDMETLAELLFVQLRRGGWEYEHFTCLEPALKRIAEYPYFDLVLLDLSLPDSRSPMATVLRIPEITPKYSMVRVISGYDSPEIVAAVKAAGADFETKQERNGQPNFIDRLALALAGFNTARQKKISQNISELKQFLDAHAT